jgi:putative transposase
LTAVAKFEIPEGWTAQAYRFALDPSPSQMRMLESHCGAARFAFNYMLRHVVSVMNQRAAERTYGLDEEALTAPQGWSLAALRRTWNQHKAQVAPWWQLNSKEAYNTGLDGLARALEAWDKSRKR